MSVEEKRVEYAHRCDERKQQQTQGHASPAHKRTIIDTDTSRADAPATAAAAAAAAVASSPPSAPVHKSAKTSHRTSPSGTTSSIDIRNNISSDVTMAQPQQADSTAITSPHTVAAVAPLAAAVTATAVRANTDGHAGSGGAPAAAASASSSSSSSSGMSAAASASYAAQVAAAQRTQLATMQKLQSLSSFERCNQHLCQPLYTQLGMHRDVVVSAAMGADEVAGVQPAPLPWRLETFTPVPGHNFDYYTGIPGSTFMLPPDPSFYLPESLKLARNCAEMRDRREQQRRAATAAAAAAATATAAAQKSMVDTAAAATSAVTAAPATAATTATAATAAAAPAASRDAAASPPPPPFEEWCLNMLCDTDLQSSMEDAGVLNSWHEGSYLSVIRTDGDGNCLCHALMTAAYGYSDSAGTLRDCGMWELMSTARRASYLERYMHEQAKLIGSASSIDAPPAAAAAAAAAASSGQAAAVAAPPPRVLDADDRRNLESEFDKCIEGMNKLSNYLEPIHIFALAHVLRRAIIVYGKKHIGGERAQQHPDTAQHQPHMGHDGEERKSGESGQAASSAHAAPAPCQLNHMVGIYLPIFWHEQHKLNYEQSANNPRLKPLCVLYSCADERTGAGGHFSALTHTDGMFPEPGLVPLQQWDGFDPRDTSALTPTTHRPQQLPPAAPLPLLPLRFLLPDELARAHHYLNKHLEVVQTHTGCWYAKYQKSGTQQYLAQGWLFYQQLAGEYYSKLIGSGLDEATLNAAYSDSVSMTSEPSQSPQTQTRTSAQALLAAALAASSPTLSDELEDNEFGGRSSSPLDADFDYSDDEEGEEEEEGEGGVATSLYASGGRAQPHGVLGIPDLKQVATVLQSAEHGKDLREAIQHATLTWSNVRNFAWQYQVVLLSLAYRYIERLENICQQLPVQHSARICSRGLALQRLAWLYLLHFPSDQPPRKGPLPPSDAVVEWIVNTCQQVDTLLQSVGTLARWPSILAQARGYLDTLAQSMLTPQTQQPQHVVTATRPQPVRPAVTTYTQQQHSQPQPQQQQQQQPPHPPSPQRPPPSHPVAPAAVLAAAARATAASSSACDPAPPPLVPVGADPVSVTASTRRASAAGGDEVPPPRSSHHSRNSSAEELALAIQMSLQAPPEEQAE